MTVHPPCLRQALLRTAAKVLLSRMPTWQARFSVAGHAYRARFEWPGVVTVADDNTGEVLARSVPGEPAEPDADTLRRDMIFGRG
jgi:hypothetical protein